MAEVTQMPLASALDRPNEVSLQTRHLGEVRAEPVDRAMPLDLHYPAGDTSLWDRITDPAEFGRMTPITMMFLGGGIVTSMEQLLARLAASHPGLVTKILTKLGWMKASGSTPSSSAAKVVDASTGKGALDAELPTAKPLSIPKAAVQNALVAERELLLKQQYILYRQGLMTEQQFLDTVERANQLHQATIGPTTKMLSTGEKVVIRTTYSENYILVEVAGRERSLRLKFNLQTEAGRQSERESFLSQLYLKMPEMAQSAPAATSTNLPITTAPLARAGNMPSVIPQQLHGATMAAEGRLRQLALPQGQAVNPDAVASAVRELNRTAVKTSWAVLRNPSTGEIIEDVSFTWEYLPDGSIWMVIEGSRQPVSWKFGPDLLGNIAARIEWLIQCYLKERPALPVRELR